MQWGKRQGSAPLHSLGTIRNRNTGSQICHLPPFIKNWKLKQNVLPFWAQTALTSLLKPHKRVSFTLFPVFETEIQDISFKHHWQAVGVLMSSLITASGLQKGHLRSTMHYYYLQSFHLEAQQLISILSCQHFPFQQPILSRDFKFYTTRFLGFRPAPKHMFQIS